MKLLKFRVNFLLVCFCLGLEVFSMSPRLMGQEQRSDEDLSISDLIENVANQLVEAQEKLDNRQNPITFIGKQLELEVHFGVKRTKSASGGIKFVVFVQGDKAKSTEKGHKIKLTFDMKNVELKKQQEP